MYVLNIFICIDFYIFLFSFIGCIDDFLYKYTTLTQQSPNTHYNEPKAVLIIVAQL